jgi:hypothetical protein
MYSTVRRHLVPAAIGAVIATIVTLLATSMPTVNAQGKPGCLILQGTGGPSALATQINARFAEGYDVKGFSWLATAYDYTPFAVVCRR